MDTASDSFFIDIMYVSPLEFEDDLPHDVLQAYPLDDEFTPQTPAASEQHAGDYVIHKEAGAFNRLLRRRRKKSITSRL